MSRPPVLRAREVIAILGKLGFIEVRQKGAHKRFQHADGRRTTVPVHKGYDISPLLLRKITADIQMKVDDFLAARG